MRIAHFSDIHLLALGGHGVRQFLNKRMLGGANVLLNRSKHYRNEAVAALVADLNARDDIDHVCVTGDVTNLGLAAEFELARQVLGGLKLGAHHVSVIPGNHDYYTHANVAGDDFCRSFGPHLTSDVALSDGQVFPYLRVRGEAAFIGLSTGVVSGWGLAYGRLGQAQLDALALALAHPATAGKARIVLIHHPPIQNKILRRGRSLLDAPALGEVLRRHGAELILHGHEHHDLAYEIAGPGDSRIPVRGVPSGAYVGRRKDRHARYHVYTLEPGTGGRPVLAASVEVRVYDPAAGSLSAGKAAPGGIAALRT